MQILRSLGALGLARCASNFRYLSVEYMSALVLSDLLLLFSRLSNFPAHSREGCSGPWKLSQASSQRERKRAFRELATGTG